MDSNAFMCLNYACFEVGVSGHVRKSDSVVQHVPLRAELQNVFFLALDVCDNFQGGQTL